MITKLTTYYTNVTEILNLKSIIPYRRSYSISKSMNWKVNIIFVNLILSIPFNLKDVTEMIVIKIGVELITPLI